MDLDVDVLRGLLLLAQNPTLPVAEEARARPGRGGGGRLGEAGEHSDRRSHRHCFAASRYVLSIRSARRLGGGARRFK